MIPPIEKTLVVPLPPDLAFDLFTAGIGTWWPTETHSLSAGAGSRARAMTVEPRLGGRIIETMHDGTTAPWATITNWRPGEALGLDWYVGRPETEATKVSVRFTAEGGGTRVDLTHRGFDTLGEGSETTAENYRTGWDRVLLDCYGRAATASAA